MSPRLDALETLLIIFGMFTVAFSAYLWVDDKVATFLEECRERRAHNRRVAARRVAAQAERWAPVR